MCSRAIPTGKTDKGAGYSIIASPRVQRVRGLRTKDLGTLTSWQEVLEERKSPPSITSEGEEKRKNRARALYWNAIRWKTQAKVWGRPVRQKDRVPS